VQRLLITGANGLLGSNLVRLAAGRFETLGLHSVRSAMPGATKVDLTDASAASNTVRNFRPDVLIHAAAMTGPVDCEKRPEEAMRVNVDATRQIARLATELGARFLFLSTDLVFDGNKGSYREEDPVGPLSHYGRTKVLAEQAAAECAPGALIVRTSLMVGTSPRGDRSVNETMKAALDRGETLRLFTDEYRSLIGVTNLAEALLELAGHSESGILHLSGPERRSRYEWGVLIARHFGWDLSRIQPVKRAEVKLFPPRPPDVSLDIGKARRVLKTPIRTIEEVLRDLGR
jgi:dTDP-4-dehydrorhamnose reductase